MHEPNIRHSPFAIYRLAIAISEAIHTRQRTRQHQESQTRLRPVEASLPASSQLAKMGKKKRGHPDIEEVLTRPWCYYCIALSSVALGSPDTVDND